MEQIPKEVLPNTLSLLCIDINTNRTSRLEILYYCSMLGLSLTAFHAATSNLLSVLDIREFVDGMPAYFSFCHTSFTDFLSDVTRSGQEFCVNGPGVQQRCLEAIVNYLYRTSLNHSEWEYLWGWAITYLVVCQLPRQHFGLVWRGCWCDNSSRGCAAVLLRIFNLSWRGAGERYFAATLTDRLGPEKSSRRLWGKEC